MRVLSHLDVPSDNLLTPPSSLDVHYMMMVLQQLTNENSTLLTMRNPSLCNACTSLHSTLACDRTSALLETL